MEQPNILTLPYCLDSHTQINMTVMAWKLQSLSIELLIHIFSFLPQGTLHALTLASKEAHILSNPLLYRHIRISRLLGSFPKLITEFDGVEENSKSKISSTPLLTRTFWYDDNIDRDETSAIRNSYPLEAEEDEDDASFISESGQMDLISETDEDVSMDVDYESFDPGRVLLLLLRTLLRRHDLARYVRSIQMDCAGWLGEFDPQSELDLMIGYTRDDISDNYFDLFGWPKTARGEFQELYDTWQGMMTAGFFEQNELPRPRLYLTGSPAGLVVSILDLIPNLRRLSLVADYVISTVSTACVDGLLGPLTAGLKTVKHIELVTAPAPGLYPGAVDDDDDDEWAEGFPVEVVLPILCLPNLGTLRVSGFHSRTTDDFDRSPEYRSQMANIIPPELCSVQASLKSLNLRIQEDDWDFVVPLFPGRRSGLHALFASPALRGLESCTISFSKPFDPRPVPFSYNHAIHALLEALAPLYPSLRSLNLRGTVPERECELIDSFELSLLQYRSPPQHMLFAGVNSHPAFPQVAAQLLQHFTALSELNIPALLLAPHGSIKLTESLQNPSMGHHVASGAWVPPNAHTCTVSVRGWGNLLDFCHATGLLKQVGAREQHSVKHRVSSKWFDDHGLRFVVDESDPLYKTSSGVVSLRDLADARW
ncbi:hypothetical protein DL93DRAFT_2230339 [Clavulina sp. PMI_390]|nr:hypothetical protein DL93DRAFT_2230339 [Clavulina sp. PMI_390]